ncbi:MAG TPA: cation transporter [Burkholderiales bacterium]|nr:cation transporter [Burkholderiales bacterium]
MAHFRRQVGAAAALNTVIFVVEAVAGVQAKSLSLVMDSVHNLSDQMALVFLYLAFVLSSGLSRNLLRSANLFNSVGLIAVSAFLLWQAVERVANPVPIAGIVPIAVGLAAALGNWGVARLLREPAGQNASIRLAYLHNLGDIQVSLAPVASGVLVTLTGMPIFDPLVAALIALWIIVSTTRETIDSKDELISPERMSCGHDEGGS